MRLRFNAQEGEPAWWVVICMFETVRVGLHYLFTGSF
jgi:hypothetical protein